MTDELQQHRIAVRKTQILDAAAVIFARKGFHSTTTRDIARQAGVAEGTIYTYFENKSSLLVGIFERMRASVIQDTLPISSEMHDARSFIRLMLQHALMPLEADNFALFRIVVSEMMVNEELRMLYGSRILEPTLALAEEPFTGLAVQRGLTPIAAKLTFRAISSMVLGLMLQRSLGDPVLDAHWEMLPNIVADLIADGMPDEQH